MSSLLSDGAVSERTLGALPRMPDILYVRLHPQHPAELTKKAGNIVSGLSQLNRALQCFRVRGVFPGELRFGAAKVTIRRRFAVNRAQ